MNQNSQSNKREDQEGQPNYKSYRCISKAEVRDALMKMKTNKAGGVGRIRVEI